MSAKRSRSLTAAGATVLLTLTLPATAALAADGVIVKRNGNPAAPFASSIWVGDTLYLAGALAPPTPHPDAAPGGKPVIEGDTHTQTVAALTSVEKTLKDQGLTLGDVVQMHVYLAGDPKLGGKMDYPGFNSAYAQFFGTKEQPNKPVRATVQVAALAFPEALVEIEVVAARGAAAK